jgi:hypothetical protein
MELIVVTIPAAHKVLISAQDFLLYGKNQTSINIDPL